MTYQNSPSPQTSSRLLQLPAELLLMILRLLHKSPRVLYYSIREYVEVGYDPNVQLSSQLLRCCQSLHIDGERILYGGNTLGIICDNFWNHENGEERLGHCCFLDTAIELPSHSIDVPRSSFDLLSWTETSSTAPGARPPAYDLSLIDTDRYAAALRFTKLEVDMTLREPEAVFLACRLLKDLVNDKQVTLTSPVIVWDEVKECAQVAALPFMYWRCHSITFCKICEAEWDNVDAVSTVITSLEPGKDCLPMAQDLHALLTNDPGVRLYKEGLYDHNTSDDVSELWNAVWALDVSFFDKHKNNILRNAWTSEQRHWAEEAGEAKLLKRLESNSICRRRRANKVNDREEEEEKRNMREKLEHRLRSIDEMETRSSDMIVALLAREV